VNVALNGNTVYESGLVGGSAAGVATTRVTGTLSLGDPDGLADIQRISIAGREFIIESGGLSALVGQTIDTGYGLLTVDSYANGEFGFSYVLQTNVDNDSDPAATPTQLIESIPVSVSDREATASSAISIIISDDRPVAGFDLGGDVIVLEGNIGTALGSLTVDLDQSGTGATSGADTPALKSFSIGIVASGADSGLKTIAGETIRLYADGELIVGRTSSSGPNVFTVSVNPTTGVLSVTLLAALEHPSTQDVITIAPDVLIASVSVTDADGDTDTAQLDVSTLIGFGDSTPTILSADSGSIDNQAGLSLSGQVSVVAPDQPVSYSLAPSLGMAPGGVTYTMQPDGSLIGRDATGETVFTLSIDADGKYTFTLLKAAPEEIASSPNFSGLVMNAGKPTESALTALYQSYDSNGNGVGDPVTSVTFYSLNGNLQPSNDGLGIGSNLIDNPRSGPAEVLTMRFTDVLSSASLHIGNLKSSDGLIWKVYKDGVLVDEGLVTDRYTGGNGLEVDITNSESPDYWIDLSRNGLDPGAAFDTIEISGDEGTSYKLIAFTVEKPLSFSDTSLGFGVEALDADGDTSGSTTFSVLLDGSGSVISDTSGDTVLMGGSGSDVFTWSLAEPGANDTVGGFSLAEPGDGGDVLDLSDLLPAGIGSGSLSSYLQFEAGADGSTVLKVSSSGEFNGDSTHDAGVSYQSIELQGVDLLSMGSDQQIIDYLKNSGKLITDG
jgi:hypothetical protein